MGAAPRVEILIEHVRNMSQRKAKRRAQGRSSNERYAEQGSRTRTKRSTAKRSSARDGAALRGIKSDIKTYFEWPASQSEANRKREGWLVQYACCNVWMSDARVVTMRSHLEMSRNTQGSVNEPLRARRAVCEAEEFEITRNRPKMANIAVVIALMARVRA